MDPHGPYRPPRPYNKIYLKDRFNSEDTQVPISKQFPIEPGHIPKYIAEGNITSANYYICQYDGEISFTDEQIGLLLRKLQNLNAILEKKLLVIITADHGESLGEHNIYFEHRGLYDDGLRVPLIISCDGVIPKGKVIDHQVQSIDIVPTILGILGIRIDTRMEGASLLPLILGEDGYISSYAFSEMRKQKSIRTPEWKLIYTSGENKYELYNLRDDSGELNNLAAIEEGKFLFLKEKLSAWIDQAQPKTVKVKDVLDELTKEKLKSLGYLH